MGRKSIAKPHVHRPRSVAPPPVPEVPLAVIPEVVPVSVPEVVVAVPEVSVSEVVVATPVPAVRDPKLVVADEISDKLKRSKPHPLISLADLVPLTVSAINLAQKQSMKGADRKRLVLHALGKLVSETSLLSDDAKAHASSFIEHQLPLLIDSLVMAANNPYSLGKVSPGTCCGCF